MPEIKLPLSESVLKRFWAKIDRNGPVPPHRPEIGPCWTWKGKPTIFGYGVLQCDGETQKAHRISWVVHNYHPGDRQVLHHCDNRICVRPAHLFVGTHMDNVQDKVKKGRQYRPSGERCHWAILTEDQVVEVKRMVLSGVHPRNVGESFGVSRAAVDAIMKGKNWKHLRAS